ncbi:hypothetical protein ALC53_12940, partial [Atta colombica]
KKLKMSQNDYNVTINQSFSYRIIVQFYEKSCRGLRFPKVSVCCKKCAPISDICSSPQLLKVLTIAMSAVCEQSIKNAGVEKFIVKNLLSSIENSITNSIIVSSNRSMDAIVEMFEMNEYTACLKKKNTRRKKKKLTVKLINKLIATILHKILINKKEIIVLVAAIKTTGTILDYQHKGSLLQDVFNTFNDGFKNLIRIVEIMNLIIETRFYNFAESIDNNRINTAEHT